LQSGIKSAAVVGVCIFLILSAAGGQISTPDPAAAKGYLFIIGGGDLPEAMMKRFVDLASGFGSGKIVIFTMASSVPRETGPELVSEFKKLGARSAEYHHLTRKEALAPESVRLVDGAGGVYFSGGDQAKHTAVLLDTPLHKRLLELYNRGATMGGTSAGAAVMSQVMITGEERRKPKEGHEFETLETGNVMTSPGLGFITEAIIDQHFVRRKRHNRLISLLAEHPRLLGIGIDESTAILVKPGRTFEVMGSGAVLVYDPGQARFDLRPDKTFSAVGIVLHILTEGRTYDLQARRVLN
jgi:cyanophycinase